MFLTQKYLLPIFSDSVDTGYSFHSYTIHKLTNFCKNHKTHSSFKSLQWQLEIDGDNNH